MAAATPPAQGNNNGSPTPLSMNANGRYRTGDDVDPLREERTGLIREVGCQAIWSLSSCKPGFGVDQLRDQSLENYWQSDGQLPHLVNIQFRRKMTIRDICIYTDFKLDESYTPSKISIRCGTHFNDLQEVELVEFSEPSGWVQIFLKDIRDRPIRTFMLQLAVLSNHQNGRDTHLRQIRIHSPVDNLPVAVFQDVSIWLHQLVKGFRDKDGNPLPNAHLLGVFHRVCKLLNYGIKPVFVFDGGVPILKRQTLAARRQRKLESLDKAELSRQKILNAFLQQQLQRQARVALPPSLRMQAKIAQLSDGGSKRSPTVSPKKGRPAGFKDDDEVDEDLEAFRAALVAKLEDDVDEVDQKNRSQTTSDSDDDDPSTYRYGVDYSENFSVIQEPEFDSLPLETQHEILFEMQESRKMNSWGKFDQMPKDLQSFSSFQMDRLCKRRTLQKKIQSVQQEMGQRHIHVQNLDDLLKMDYNFDKKETQVLGSKEDGFVLIKSQEPKKAKPEEEKASQKPGPSTSTSSAVPEIITIDDFIEDSSDEDNEIVETSKNCDSSEIKETEFIKTEESKIIERGDDEEEKDLQLAIQLSLMEAEERKREGSSEKLTSNIRPTFTETLPESFKKSTSTPLESITSSQMSHCAKFLDTIGFPIPNAPSSDTISTTPSNTQQEGTQETELVKEQSESESDDDFEEVDDENPSELPFPSKPENNVESGQRETVVTIDLSSLGKTSVSPEDDIFADIFSGTKEEKNINEDYETEKHSIQSRSRMDDQDEKEDIISIPQPSKREEELPSQESAVVDADINWDSDDEIENDLMEMVLAESASAFENVNEPEKEKNSPTSPNTAAQNVSTSSALGSTDREETVKEDEKSSSDEAPKRIITAEYMQAQEQLNSRLDKLQSEKGLQERVATSISDQMQIETQELISLFGIPYVISPTEAESQCAFLDKACLTEGSITDDSDVWLFGGQRVYKNFFSQGQNHVEFYQAADIQRVLNLSREKLIVLAMLVGCDYTEGIQGVGPVLALEIMSEFSSPGIDSFEILIKFHDWWEQIQGKKPNVFAGSKVKEKLRKLKIRPGFPSKAVYEAFMNPSIDTSTEPFKWGNPDLDAIRGYVKQKFGWEQSKCDSFLLPVLKNLRCEREQSRQLTLDSYISIGKMPALEYGKRKKASKRMENAMKRLKQSSGELNLSSESDSDGESGSKKVVQEEQVTNRDSQDRKRAKATKGRKKETQSAAASSSSSSAAAPGVGKKPVKAPAVKLTFKPEVIPQRVQAETDKLKNKQKAIEIFKKKKGK